MGDNDYENVNGWQPILLQNPQGQYVRDPWLSWWEHRQRGSLGGVDCAALEGTPIYAPANCYIANTPLEQGGSGGRTVTATYNNGWKDQFMHLQSFVTAGSKQKGMVIGYTGRSVASGYPAVAQHLHWHRIDPNGYYDDPYGRTNRRNPWSYFVGSSGAGGGGTTPIEEDDMFDANDRASLNEALRLVRLMILALGGGSTPATHAEIQYVQKMVGLIENTNEARRQGGVNLGVIAPAPGESRPL